MGTRERVKVFEIGENLGCLLMLVVIIGGLYVCCH